MNVSRWLCASCWIFSNGIPIILSDFELVDLIMHISVSLRSRSRRHLQTDIIAPLTTSRATLHQSWHKSIQISHEDHLWTMLSQCSPSLPSRITCGAGGVEFAALVHWIRPLVRAGHCVPDTQLNMCVGNRAQWAYLECTRSRNRRSSNQRACKDEKEERKNHSWKIGRRPALGSPTCRRAFYVCSQVMKRWTLEKPALAVG